MVCYVLFHKFSSRFVGSVYDMPKGTWSDDSSMALATLASILECGVISPENVMVNFCLWEVKGEFTPFGEAFDQGNTCTEAILPVCLYYYEMQDKSSCDISKEADRRADIGREM
jgi:ADP-ribosylglycohydrolase